MRHTNYTKVTVEGFQSAGKPISIRLDSTGLNLIKGDNGAGKSTLLFNAIYWAEYGGNIKKSIATWEDRRPEGFRGTRVVVERSDNDFDYMIARHLGFKGTTRGLVGGDKLMVFKKPKSDPTFTDAHLQGDKLHKSDMQDMINDQLGINMRTFQNSIMFGQRMASFVDSDNKDKRLLFDQLFDVAFVDQAKKKADSESTKLSSEITTLDNSILVSENNLTSMEEKLEEQKEQLDNFEKDKKVRVATAKTNVDEAAEKLKVVNAEILTYEKEVKKYDFAKLDKLELSIKELKAKKIIADSKYKTDSTAVESFLKEIEDSKKQEAALLKQLAEIKTECPTCGGKIPESKITGAKKSLKDQANKEVAVMKALSVKWMEAVTIRDNSKKEMDTITKSLDKDELEAKKYSGDKASFGIAKTNLTNKTNRKTELESEIVKLTAVWEKEKAVKKPDVKTEDTEVKITELKEAIKESEASVAVKLARLNKVKWWITKGFGSSGLKSFVFNAMLSQLNVFSHKYSMRLGFRVEFSIDTTKASKPFQTLVYDGDMVRDYEDLSGGQKQRADIVIAFAMHDLVSFNSDINILVMDELFEGLDNEGIEAAFELIREKAETKAVYLITHVDFVDALNTRSMTFGLDEDKNTYIKY